MPEPRPCPYDAIGFAHHCIRTPERTVRCAGANDHGQLGTGDRVPSTDERDVPGLTGVAAVGANGDTTCALLDTGDVRCWGREAGPPVPSPFPFSFANEDALTPSSTSVSDGTVLRDTCVVRQTGRASCFPFEKDLEDRGRPFEAPGATALTVRAGLICVVAGGQVRCPDTRWRTPVAGTGAVRDIASTQDVVCALRTDARVSCFGSTTDGELGDGAKPDGSYPVSSTPIDIPVRSPTAVPG